MSDTSVHSIGMQTKGIHLAWTAYGTWLPGDPRGHWSALFDLYGRLARAGHQLNLPDPTTLAHARQEMSEEPKLLDPVEQMLVGAMIGGFITGEGPAAPWAQAGYPTPLEAWALAVERTHVHMLIAPPPRKVGGVVGRVKGTSSSALRKLPGNRARRRIWTTGYWKAFLYDDAAVRAVQDYIEQHNVRRGFGRRRFDFVGPVE